MAMTDEEFASKIENEGAYYAFADYGLKSTDLADQDGELAEAVRALEAVKDPFVAAMEDIEELVQELI